jgi:hypothetical protein
LTITIVGMNIITPEQKAFLDKWRLPYLASTTAEQADAIIQAAQARAGLLGKDAKKNEDLKYKKNFNFNSSYDKNRGNKGINK